MIEQTLILLKPDAVQRGLIGEIITRFERCGLKLVAMKMAYPDEKLAGDHYIADENWLETVGEKQRKNYKLKGMSIEQSNKELGLTVRKSLIDFLRLSPVVALVLEGHNAILHVRKLVGDTSPEQSAPGTIRGDYSFDTYQLADTSKRALQNLIHASSSQDDAKREIGLWFTNQEIHSWKRIDEELLYRQGE
ncbi:MAG: nucleoside-diphosphate kinase [Candidatus Woesearchaeota archaeon]